MLFRSRYRVRPQNDDRESEIAARLQDGITAAAEVSMKAPQQGRGNDGTVESVANHEQVSPSSHRPLEISQGRRDSHIPTARRHPAGERGKPKSGFPHSPADARDGDCESLFRTAKPNPRAFRPKDRRKAASRSSAAAFSVSACVGNESRFQYHSSIGKCC